MLPAIFAAPDFGAAASGNMVILLITVTIAALVLLGVWWAIRAAKSPKQRAVIATCISLAAITAGYSVWLYTFKPARDFETLLAGGTDIRVESLEITGQGRQVVLTDIAAIEYLTDRIRLAARNEHKLGLTYYARVYLSSGGFITCGVHFPEEAGFLTILFPINGFHDGSYYLIALPEPMPQPLSEAIATLR